MLTKRIIRYRKNTGKPPLPPWQYALLEVGIIIIGILLSVAIAELFSDRKDEQREQKYLTALVQDLQMDLRHLKRDLNLRSMQVEAANSILGVLDPGTDKAMVGRALAGNLPKISTTVSFNPNVATFRTLESTGRLELIGNDTIVRDLIALYSRYYDMLGQNNDDVNRYRNNFLLPFMVENFNFKMVTGQPTKTPLLQEEKTNFPLFVNHLIYLSISLGSTTDAYRETIDHAKLTLSRIERSVD